MKIIQECSSLVAEGEKQIFLKFLKGESKIEEEEKKKFNQIVIIVCLLENKFIDGGEKQ